MSWARLRGLILGPSKKDSSVRRWQRPGIDYEEMGKQVRSARLPAHEFAKNIWGGGKILPTVAEGGLFDFPNAHRLATQKTRYTPHQSTINQSLIALVDRRDPIFDFLNEHVEPLESPFAYTDRQGRSLIVLPEDVKRDFPEVYDEIRESIMHRPATSEEVTDLVALHEYTHAWDRGAVANFDLDRFKQGDIPPTVTHIVMDKVFGAEGGRIPAMSISDIDRNPRLRYALVGGEFPAVMTEMAHSNPDTLSKIADTSAPWLPKYLNALWGNDFGDRMVGGADE